MDPIGEHVHPYSYQSVGGGDGGVTSPTTSIIEMEVNSTRTINSFPGHVQQFKLGTR